MLEISDKIFLIKLRGKFEENFQPPVTSHYLDDINMIQVVHKHSNFLSKFLYFSSIQTSEKNLFFLYSFFLHFFFLQFFFLSNFEKTKWSLREKKSKSPLRAFLVYISYFEFYPVTLVKVSIF